MLFRSCRIKVLKSLIFELQSLLENDRNQIAGFCPIAFCRSALIASLWRPSPSARNELLKGRSSTAPHLHQATRSEVVVRAGHHHESPAALVRALLQDGIKLLVECDNGPISFMLVQTDERSRTHRCGACYFYQGSGSVQQPGQVLRSAHRGQPRTLLRTGRRRYSHGTVGSSPHQIAYRSAIVRNGQPPWP